MEKEREEKRKGETWREEGPAKPSQTKPAPSRPAKRKGREGRDGREGRKVCVGVRIDKLIAKRTW